MRISIYQFTMVFVFASVANANSGKAQAALERQITVNLENHTIFQAIEKLEHSAGVKFIYAPDIFKNDIKVNATFENATLETVLKKILLPFKVEYEADGSDIVLKQQSPAKTSTEKIEIEATQKKDGKTVTGTVKDEKGEPMPFVSVIIKGTTVGAATDINGVFSIQASDEDVLVFSFLSYKTQEIKVGSQTNITVAMEEDTKLLDEVVAVGYGQMKRTDLSSAQVSISSKDLERTVNTSLEQAMQGRAAGVQVTQNSGQPGGGISVNIRGVATLNGNTQPLYVIDGIQISGAIGGADNSSASSTNPLAGINPTDIESMEILQGPSATAIYGSRATNGVVLIKTKRGKAGKMQVEYNLTYTSQQAPTKQLDMINLQQYALVYNDLASKNSVTPNPDFANPSLLGQGTNWQNAIYQSAPLVKHQLSFKGGDEKTTYYLSGEYFNQAGVAIGSNFDRYSVRLNLDNQTTKWLKMGTNILASQTHDKVTSSADDLINTALSQNPSVAVTNADGSFGGPTTTANQAANPVGLAKLNQHLITRNNVYGGLNAEIALYKGLVFRTSFNGNFTNSTNYDWKPSYVFGGFSNPTAVSARGYDNSYYYVLNELLQYNTKLGTKHDISLMASHENQAGASEGLAASASGFITNQVTELGAGTQYVQPSSYRGQNTLESYLGRVNYTFNDKYIVLAAFRADGSSSFGPNNKWGYFPSVSAAWRISQENFLKNVKQISELKLRLEAGQTGNQSIQSGLYSPLLNSVQTGFGIGFLPAIYANPDIKWEATATYNAGLNVSLFNNRIEFIGDIYYKHTSGLLVQKPIPAYMGSGVPGSGGPGTLGAPYVNLGDMENKGIALTLNTVNIEKPFTWRTSANFSINQNKLTKLYSDNAAVTKSYYFLNNGFQIQRATVGEPIWQFYGYEYAGLIQNTTQLYDLATPVPEANRSKRDYNDTWVGDILYKDLNHDSIINTNDVAIIGNPWPGFTFGFTNSFSYKNFDLSILCQGSYGNDIYNYTKFKYSNPGIAGGKLAETFNYAKLGTDADGNTYIINSGTDVPRLLGGNGNFDRLTDKFVESGSYLRVKNITLSYNFPRELLARISKNYITNLRLSVGAQNLFTITSYSGYDPEVGSYIGAGSNPSNTVYGVDYGRYPQVRSYTFNLSLNF